MHLDQFAQRDEPDDRCLQQAGGVHGSYLKSSVTALADPALLTGGKAGIRAALDSVKTNLDGVASSAKGVYEAKVDAVKSAVNDLQTALGNLGNGSATSNLRAVGTAIANIGTTAAALVSMLEVECPSN
jgi:hypothetical protein